MRTLQAAAIHTPPLLQGLRHKLDVGCAVGLNWLFSYDFCFASLFLLSSFMLVTSVPCQPGIFENIAVMPINLTKYEGAKNEPHC